MQYILDTNVYRNLVHGKTFCEIKNEIHKIKRENNNDLKFAFSNVVCIELLNHLTEKDQALNECFKALYYKIRLCSNFEAVSTKGILIPEFNEILSLYFFKKTSTHFILNNNLLSLAYQMTQVNDSKNIINFTEQIRQTIHYQNSELQDILKNIEVHYISKFSETKNWSVFKDNENLKKEFKSLCKNKIFHELFSLALIKMTFDKEKISTTHLNQNVIKKFTFDFSLSIDFFIENIWKKLIDIEKIEYFSIPKSDPKKRWNSFYDTQIIMACEFENCYGRKTKLVTTEKKILNHFKKHKKEDWCISYDEFCNKIIN